MIRNSLEPILSRIRSIESLSLTYPTVSDSFNVVEATCALTVPSVQLRTISPIAGMVESVLAVLEPIDVIPGGLADAVRDACNTALDNLDNIDTSCCCRDIRNHRLHFCHK
jgi:hypothetical protein